MEGREEVGVLQVKIEEVVQTAREMLLPRDETDDRDVVLEVRAGTGGDEAATVELGADACLSHEQLL